MRGNRAIMRGGCAGMHGNCESSHSNRVSLHNYYANIRHNRVIMRGDRESMHSRSANILNDSQPFSESNGSGFSIESNRGRKKRFRKQTPEDIFEFRLSSGRFRRPRRYCRASSTAFSA
jgi:hypothetical protein